MSTTRFTVTQQHIDLLRNASVRWNDVEFGAPGIDPKMPYGSSMDIYGDIAKILGIRPVPHECAECEDEFYYPDQIDLMERLHRETLPVLQIVLDTGVMQPGVYENVDYGAWKRVEEA